MPHKNSPVNLTTDWNLRTDVHLYNQNVVSSLRTIQQQCVTKDDIDDRTDKQIFIGEEIPTVWKIPFRIKDYPYCESSHLRDTVAVLIGNDEDLSWDDPFKTLDKGCQTNFSIKEETFSRSKKKNEQFTNFINTPYNRDPKTAENNYKEQTYKYIEDLYEDEKIDNSNDEWTIRNENNELIMPEKIKRLSPLPEESHYLTPKTEETNCLSIMSEDSENSASKINENIPIHNGISKSHLSVHRLSPETHKSHYRDKLQKDIQPKVNPIAELELKGKQIPRNDPLNDDEPPFNFQAMLRKTNYNRNSLKRYAPPTDYLKPQNTISSNSAKAESFQTADSKQSTIFEYNDQMESFQSPTYRRQSNYSSTTETTNSAKKSPLKSFKSTTNQNEINQVKRREAASETFNEMKHWKTNIQNKNGNYKKLETPEKEKSSTYTTQKKKSMKRNDSLDSIKLLIGVAKDFEKETMITENLITVKQNEILITTEILPGLVIVGGPATDL